MEVQLLIQISFHAFFILISLMFTLKKKGRKLIWLDSIILLLLLEILILVIHLLEKVHRESQEETEKNARIYYLSALTLNLVSKLRIVFKNNASFLDQMSMLSILTFDFIMMLYQMGFEFTG